LLNLVAMAAPHLLILDEPTNHLDIDSRRALLDALNDYEGAVILITHDRSLIELVADRLWLTADGSIKAFQGDMDDYARFVLERAKAGGRAPSQSADHRAAAADLGDAEAVLSAEQDAAQEARFAAKKAAKKRRRRGY
jgi:ATP-binding cassette, subfamily F, member 3